MKIAKRVIKWIVYFLLIPVLYVIISLILSSISIDRKVKNQVSEKSIYLSTNGIHLNVVIPKDNMDSLLLLGLKREQSDRYLSFGWGDENFYLNTPTWGDLTFGNAFKAVFLKSSTLLHVTRYNSKHPDWIEIKITENELKKLNTYLQSTFKTKENGMKIILENQGYTAVDDFYKAKGSYSCFKTCNRKWIEILPLDTV